MDRYEAIKKNLIEVARKDTKIKAIVAIGSSTRDVTKADEYSDLDIIIVTEEPDSWIRWDSPNQLGEIKISFLERTVGGGIERRILYDGSLDVDMIVLTPEQAETSIIEGEADMVCNRGYTVLYDTNNYKELLDKYINPEIKQTNLSEDEFNNMVQDFFFHTVWASKKILRGELWSAKMCIDTYLKNYLLTMMELYSINRYHVDVWHNGRFLDRWADEIIRNELKHCFAHYDREDMVSALFATAHLFQRLAEEVAKMKQYTYPKGAEEYAGHLLKSYFE